MLTIKAIMKEEFTTYFKRKGHFEHFDLEVVSSALKDGGELPYFEGRASTIVFDADSRFKVEKRSQKLPKPSPELVRSSSDIISVPLVAEDAGAQAALSGPDLLRASFFTSKPRPGPLVRKWSSKLKVVTFPNHKSLKHKLCIVLNFLHQLNNDSDIDVYQFLNEIKKYGGKADWQPTINRILERSVKLNTNKVDAVFQENFEKAVMSWNSSSSLTGDRDETRAAITLNQQAILITPVAESLPEKILEEKCLDFIFRCKNICYGEITHPAASVAKLMKNLQIIVGEIFKYLRDSDLNEMGKINIESVVSKINAVIANHEKPGVRASEVNFYDDDFSKLSKELAELNKVTQIFEKPSISKSVRGMVGRQFSKLDVAAFANSQRKSQRYEAYTYITNAPSIARMKSKKIALALGAAKVAMKKIAPLLFGGAIGTTIVALVGAHMLTFGISTAVIAAVVLIGSSYVSCKRQKAKEAFTAKKGKIQNNFKSLVVDGAVDEAIDPLTDAARSIKKAAARMKYSSRYVELLNHIETFSENFKLWQQDKNNEAVFESCKNNLFDIHMADQNQLPREQIRIVKGFELIKDMPIRSTTTAVTEGLAEGPKQRSRSFNWLPWRMNEVVAAVSAKPNAKHSPPISENADVDCFIPTSPKHANL